MPLEIVFPDVEPRYVFERDCLGFRALVDGKPVECLISAELLFSQFDSQEFSEEALRRAFHAHRPIIEAIARSHIENGWIDEAGQVLLTTRYTRLTVTFGDQLQNWPTGMEIVQGLHRMLLQIIGSNAEKVAVEWDVSEHFFADPGITLQLSDPSLPYSEKLHFVNQEWRKPKEFRSIILAGAWAAILRARSRNLVIKSG
jgi:hypothetical protein